MRESFSLLSKFRYSYIRKVLPWSTIKQCFAAHYFDRASTDKDFFQLMVEPVETLIVGLIETLNNLHFSLLRRKIRHCLCMRRATAAANQI